MVHEIIDQIIADVKSAFPEVKEARYYKGEFEPEGEWNPVFPAVLFNCPSVVPASQAQSGWVMANVRINCFVAFKLDEQKEFFARFLPFITSLQSGGEQLEALTCALHAYINGVEVYRIELACTKLLSEE